MYCVPNAAVAAQISVPGEAERRASAAIVSVTAAVMFGLISSSFMAAYRPVRIRSTSCFTVGMKPLE